MPVQKAVIHCLCVGCFLQSRAHLIAMTLSWIAGFWCQ